MAGVFSQPPIRNQSGFTPDFPWQPLADCGAGNPFFYHQFFDDFNNSAQITNSYTETATGNGTIANAAGDGGLALFTTNSSTPATTDVASIQLPFAGFTLTSGKRLFFICRLKVSSAANVAFNVGLIQTTTTPFTVVDGIFFNKPSGASTLSINHNVASANTTAAIPAAYFTLADNTFIELGFYLQRDGSIIAFVDDQLVGFVPQSGSGSTLPNRGPAARITPAALATVDLNPTLALQSGTASSKTMTADFFAVMKER